MASVCRKLRWPGRVAVGGYAIPNRAHARFPDPRWIFSPAIMPNHETYLKVSPASREKDIIHQPGA